MIAMGITIFIDDGFPTPRRYVVFEVLVLLAMPPRSLAAMDLRFDSGPHAGTQSAHSRFCNQALSQAPVFVRTARTLAAFDIRQLIGSRQLAWAGNVRTQRSVVWEFEPAAPDSLHQPLRMTNRGPKSGSHAAVSEPAARAKTLLENLRRTPMLHGAVMQRKRWLKPHITRAIESTGVPARLASRIAFQLLLKFDVDSLGNERTWTAIGQLLRIEADDLRTGLRLTEHQILTILPKMSATEVVDLFRALQRADATIARTILNAALASAEPVPAAQQFLEQYRAVAAMLKSLEPSIARTIANSAFKMRDPTGGGIEYLTQFRQILTELAGADVAIVRTVARIACRAANPLESVKTLVREYGAILTLLTSQNVQPQIARTLATLATQSSDPPATASRLLRNFESSLQLAQITHPSVARSIALNACRAADPLAATQRSMQNYDAVVRLVSQTDPHLAHEVAGQTFRSDNPEPLALRYLQKLKAERRRSNLKGLVVPAILLGEALFRGTGTLGEVGYALMFIPPIGGYFSGGGVAWRPDFLEPSPSPRPGVVKLLSQAA